MYSDISRLAISEPGKFNNFDEVTPAKDSREQYAGLSSDKLHLNVIIKHEKKSMRQKIPANLYEKMSYLLAHVMVTMKTQSYHVHQNSYKLYIWSYILHACFKGLPTAYIHVFLGQYAPDHHLFLSKMAPLLSVTKYFIMFAAILELYSLGNYCAMLLDYVITGFIYKNPWNRCDSNFYLEKFNCTCLSLDDFKERIRTCEFINFNKIGFIDQRGVFQLSEIIYSMVREHYFHRDPSGLWIFLIYSVAVWGISLLLTGQIFKKKIWKILLGVQVFVYSFYVLTFIHLISRQIWESRFYKAIESQPSFFTQFFDVDFSLVTQSMSALPIMQILSARSAEELRPGPTSSLFVICLSFFYLFRGLLLQELKGFASDITTTPSQITEFESLHWFYVWPLYFTLFKLGNLWTLLFYITNFILEFTAMAITFNIITEVIFCEWNVRRLMSGGLIIIVGVLTDVVMNQSLIAFLNFYSSVLPSLIEMIIIYVMYPYGRLIEDIQFQYGEEPSLVPKICLIILPIYISLKTCIGVIKFNYGAKKDSEEAYENLIILSITYFAILLSVLITVMLITTFRHTFIQKKKCGRLFVPAPDWGPSKYKSRMLRKIYVSSEYIVSQAPRPLVRHMIKKSGSDYYKIDINYSFLPGARSMISAHFDEDDEELDDDDNIIIDEFGGNSREYESTTSLDDNPDFEERLIAETSAPGESSFKQVDKDKSDVDVAKSYVNLAKSDVDLAKSDVDLDKSNVDLDKSDIDVAKPKKKVENDIIKTKDISDQSNDTKDYLQSTSPEKSEGNKTNYVLDMIKKYNKNINAQDKLKHQNDDRNEVNFEPQSLDKTQSSNDDETETEGKVSDDNKKASEETLAVGSTSKRTLHEKGKTSKD